MASLRKTVLVVFAHPAYERSRANRALLGAIAGMEGVRLHDLYQTYPDFEVDAKAEQALLGEHDVLVMQHPLYWYSTPALLKQWQDLVLEHGWAYGHGGTALRDKPFMSAITTGAGLSSYTPEGANRYSLDEFLRPIEQTARLCGMQHKTPFVVAGTHGMSPGDLQQRAAAYRLCIEQLQQGDDNRAR